MRRVVITGEGAISALGRSVPDIKSAMKAGRSAIGAVSFEDSERLSIGIGAVIADYDPLDFFDKSALSFLDKFSQFALIAAQEAVTQSGFMSDGFETTRAGVVLGNSGGGVGTWNESYKTVFEAGKNRVHPFVIPKLMSNAATSQVSMKHELEGPSFTVSSACASSNHAMGQAYMLIASGMSDVMLTGGSEAMICFGGIKAWEGLRILSNDTCRPFCKTRTGMVHGEGAAVFVFEELEHAKARGAKIIAEVTGFGMSADAKDILTPDADGAKRAMRQAIENAGISTTDIGYINAHGTATTVNDRVEAAAIRDVFGEAHAAELPVSSTKSMHGHLVGGTGAVELLACTMALQDNIIAPTANFQETDPEIGLNIVPNHAIERQVNFAMSNALAFGGLNAVLVLGKA